jgi:tetratricopeptide (TPR) repeat protein
VRGLFVKALWLAPLNFGLLWGPALAGALMAWRKDRRAGFPAMFALAYCASIIPFFIVSRYRLALVPPLAMFSAAFLFWMGQKLKARSFGILGLAGAWLAFSLWLGLAPTARSREPMSTEYQILANVYLAAGRPAQALVYYDKALEAMPGSAEVVRGKGEALRKLDPEGAKELIEKERDPYLSADELIELAERARRFSRFAIAAGLYERAVEKDPDNGAARLRLASLYRSWPEIRDLDRALAHAKKALEIEPRSIEAMLELGICLAEAGRPEEAKDLFNQVLAIDPGNKDAIHDLQNLEKMEGD